MTTEGGSIMYPSEMTNQQLLIQFEIVVKKLQNDYSQEIEIAYLQAKAEILKRMPKNNG
jgi:hypothetical protein